VDSGDNVIILKHLGVGYSLIGNKLLAKIYFEKAYGFSSGDVSISVLYAECLFRLGDFSEAESVYVDALKRFPLNTQLIKGYITLLYASENWVKLLDALDLAKFILPNEIQLFKEIDAKIKSKKLEWFKTGLYCNNCGELDCNSNYLCKPYFELHDKNISPIQLEVFCYECKALSKGISPIDSFSDIEIKKIVDKFRIDRLMQKSAKSSSIFNKSLHLMRCVFGIEDQFDLESERKIELFMKANNSVRFARCVEYRKPVCLTCFASKTIPVITDSTNRFVRLTNISCQKCGSRIVEKHKIDTYLNYLSSSPERKMVYNLIKCNIDCSVISATKYSEDCCNTAPRRLEEIPEVINWDRHAIYRF
jgi:tetratricopeptide (TPR) repeat protein